MNKRIEAMILQCYNECGDYHIGSLSCFDHLKFARMIVRECIECGDDLAKHYIDTHSEKEQVMLLASIADYSNEIKKHFGIEE